MSLEKDQSMETRKWIGDITEWTELKTNEDVRITEERHRW